MDYSGTGTSGTGSSKNVTDSAKRIQQSQAQVDEVKWLIVFIKYVPRLMCYFRDNFIISFS